MYEVTYPPLRKLRICEVVLQIKILLELETVLT